MNVRIAFVAAAVLAACEASLVNVKKEDVEPFEALAEYSSFWDDTESCSGVEGELEQVSWFRASEIWSNGRLVRGLWEPPHNITVWNGLEDDRETVRHEMLHDLLRGDPEHRLPAWSDCGLLTP
jgi:hypothetical protein